jgi:hypothetical protein
MVPGTGLEPACLAALAPKASVSASSTIPACHTDVAAKVGTIFAKTACSVYQARIGQKNGSAFDSGSIALKLAEELLHGKRQWSWN